MVHMFQSDQPLVEDFECSDSPALSWTIKNVEKVHEVTLQDRRPRINAIYNILGFSYGAL
jgi:hypothetical protein